MGNKRPQESSSHSTNKIFVHILTVILIGVVAAVERWTTKHYLYQAACLAYVNHCSQCHGGYSIIGEKIYLARIGIKG